MLINTKYGESILACDFCKRNRFDDGMKHLIVNPDTHGAICADCLELAAEEDRKHAEGQA